jgi:hypothetical protein
MYKTRDQLIRLQRLENVRVQYPGVVDGVFKKRCMTFHMNVKATGKPKRESIKS